MATFLPLPRGFLEGLRRLEVVARHRAGGGAAGERTSARKGQGVEFADHRPYVPGDDPRFIDWGAFARLGRPVVKEFVEESDVAVTVLVDASASMGFGQPRRLDFASTLARVVASAALARHERAGVGVVRGDEVAVVPPGRGPGQSGRVEAALLGAEAGGRTHLATALARHFAARPPEGVVVLVSDMCDEEGPDRVLDCLVHFGADARVLLITDDAEADAVPPGPVELVDAETGEVARMMVTPEVRVAIRRSVDAWRAGVASRSADLGIPCASVELHRPVDAVVADLARRGVVLRARS